MRTEGRVVGVLRRCVLVLFLALIVGESVSAKSADALPAIQVGVVLEAPDHASLQEVMALPFAPIETPFVYKATANALWFHIEIPASVDAPAVLMVQPQQLDDLRLYRQEEGGSWQVSQAGDRTPYALRERGELFSSFDLRLSAERRTVVYLRAKTASHLALHLRLMTPAEATAWDSRLQLGMGVYMGALLIIALSSMLRWIITRNVLWAAGAAFQIETVVLILSGMGFAARYLWPDDPAIPDFGATVLPIVNLLLASVFVYVLFRRFSSHRWVARVELGLVVVNASFVVLAILGRTALALALNSLLMALSTFIGFVLVFFINPPHRQLRIVLRSTYMVTVLTATWFALPFLHVTRLEPSHLLPAMVPIAGVVIMQFFVALYDDLLTTRKAEQTRLQMQVVQMQLANEERQHAHTRHFMGMLMHEVKSPLAAIRLAAQSMLRLLSPEPSVVRRLTNIDHAVQSIDLVLERSRDMDRMESGDSPLQFEQSDLGGLVRDWVARSGAAQRIVLQAPEGELSLRADPMLLSLMVNNLLDNALKYSPADTPVELRVGLRRDGSTPEASQRVSIRVRNAVGRAGKPDPQRLFQKYYRADTARYLSGTGLGLSWVHGVAQQAGGQVRYLPEDDHVVFELDLPC